MKHARFSQIVGKSCRDRGGWWGDGNVGESAYLVTGFKDLHLLGLLHALVSPRHGPYSGLASAKFSIKKHDFKRKTSKNSAFGCKRFFILLTKCRLWRGNGVQFTPYSLSASFLEKSSLVWGVGVPQMNRFCDLGFRIAPQDFASRLRIIIFTPSIPTTTINQCCWC